MHEWPGVNAPEGGLQGRGVAGVAGHKHREPEIDIYVIVEKQGVLKNPEYLYVTFL